MKKILSLVLVTMLLIALLAGCSCEHDWKKASCEAPKTCEKCGETKGKALEHDWEEADCTTPKTCRDCDATDGAPLGHTWAAATCTDPKTCETCGKTEGDAKGHTWEDATCILPMKCAVCHEMQGDPGSHTWEEATTEAPKTCTTCQMTEGSKLDTDPRFTTAATKHLQGTWSSHVTMTGEMMGLDGYIDELSATIFLEFGKTGDFKMYLELDDYLKFLEDFKHMVAEVLYESFAEEGLSREEADQAMLTEFGMTVEEYADAEVEAMDKDEFFGMFTFDGVYYVGMEDLYIGDSWYDTFEPNEYVLEDGVLTIEEVTLEEGSEPLEFTKVEE